MTFQEFKEKYKGNNELISDVEGLLKPLDKEYYFQYMIYKLIKWELEFSEENTYSPYKVFLSIFFVSSMDTYSGNHLLDIFNNYYAWPFGPQEHDVKEILKKNQDLEYLKFETNNVIVKKENFHLNDITRQIDSNIEHLRQRNKNFVKIYPLDLTNLGESHYSFQEGKRKEDKKMSIESIRRESKTLSLNLFGH